MSTATPTHIRSSVFREKKKVSQAQTRNLKGSGSMANVKQIRLNNLYFHYALSATNMAVCVLGGKTSLAQDLPALVHKVQPWLKFGIKNRSEDSQATEIKSGELSKCRLENS